MNLRRTVLVAAVMISVGGYFAATREEKGVRAPIAKPVQIDAALPASPPSALHVGRPRLLNDVDDSMWAPVVHASVATDAPGSGRVVAHIGTRTPERTTNLVLVLRVRVTGGETWAEVRLPSASPSLTGWLSRSALGALHTVDTHLNVSLRQLRLTLLVNGVPVFVAPIGVGLPETPTPVGQFYIRNKLSRYHSPFYGPLAYGTSARSPVLTEWPAGGFIGIHGTDQPALIPGRISHGCIRVRNADLLRLSRLLPVGTPVTITGA
jgi:L,D-transpeptidase catalytic domain